MVTYLSRNMSNPEFHQEECADAVAREGLGQIEAFRLECQGSRLVCKGRNRNEIDRSIGKARPES